MEEPVNARVSSTPSIETALLQIPTKNTQYSMDSGELL